MRNFKNRVPTQPNRKKITFEDNQEVRYATVEFADNPTDEGTPINRDNIMAVQGLDSSLTNFNSDGTITTNYPDGTIVKVTFNPDGTILETVTNDAQIINKKTTFNANGSIKEEIL